jgi:Fe-S cluster assembly protein SufD
MSVALQTGAAGFLSRYEALRDRLPGDSALRAAAANAFRAAGLPGGASGRRIEAWKYTALRPLAETEFSSPLLSEQETDRIALPTAVADGGVARIVFVNGAYRADLSTPPVGFARFAEQPEFGTLSWPDREPLVALNTMLADDGAVLDMPAGVDAGTVHLVSIGAGTTAFHPRHTIRLGAGARLTVLETSSGEGDYLHNPVTEIHVAAGAHLTHARLQDESQAAFSLGTIYVEVAEHGTYDSFSLHLGGRIARVEIRATLAGQHAIAHLNAAQLLADAQHSDFTTVVRHASPNGTSRQSVKNVLTGHARGVFQGRIEVAREAQKTDGYQMNQALLLSPDAEMDCKPELEIFADDVKCSHGATIGELDAEQMFYLRSRGVPETEARVLLVRAFLAEALDAVTDEAIRAMLENGVARWWERQAG